MNNTAENPARVSQGVDELITKLRQEGVDAGNIEAEKLLIKARIEAKAIVDDAKTQAKRRLNEAQKQADTLLNSGQEALKTAMRDMVLSLKGNLTEGFKSDVMRLVKKDLQQPELLKTLIIEIAGKVSAGADVGSDKADSDTKIEFILPDTVIGLSELRDSPEKLETSRLTELVFGLTRDMLLKGVTFSTSEDVKSGMQVKLKDRDVVLDLTDQSVASMILEHLQPRFRAILEGVVR